MTMQQTNENCRFKSFIALYEECSMSQIEASTEIEEEHTEDSERERKER